MSPEDFPRPAQEEKGKQKHMNLTPEQSQYVLSTLIREGKVRSSQVQSALKGRDREIRDLRARLASLEGLGDSARGRRQTLVAPSRRSRRQMSPRVRALRKMQGKYMGYVRRLKPADKARVKVVREKQGIEAAIRLASSISGKS